MSKKLRRHNIIVMHNRMQINRSYKGYDIINHNKKK